MIILSFKLVSECKFKNKTCFSVPDSFKAMMHWDFPNGPVVKTLPSKIKVKKKRRICLPMQGMRLQSLIGELRSHMLWDN